MAAVQHCPPTFSEFVVGFWNHAAGQLWGVAFHLHSASWQIFVENFNPTSDLSRANSELKPFFIGWTSFYHWNIARLQDEDNPLSCDCS